MPVFDLACFQQMVLNPQLTTLNPQPQPSNLKPQPSTPHPTLFPKPETLNPRVQALSPKPKPETLARIPKSEIQTFSTETLNPPPQTLRRELGEDSPRLETDRRLWQDGAKVISGQRRARGHLPQQDHPAEDHPPEEERVSLRVAFLQGHLTHKKQRPPRTLQ